MVSTTLFDGINISLIISAVINLFLGVVVFYHGWRKKINTIYSLNILAIISWIIAVLFFRSATEETNLFWCTVLYITPTLIASSFLYFTYIFPSQKEKYIWWRVVLIFAINLAMIAIIAWPGLMIKEINVRPGQEKEIIFTSYYWFYFLYIAGFFSFGFLRLFLKYLKTAGIKRLQIIYLLLGYAIATNLAFATNLIMPWFGFFFLNWLGQVFTVFMVAFTAYAIIRYRLMDIRIVIRKVFIYFFSAAFAYSIFFLLVWIFDKYYEGVFTPAAYFSGLIIAPFFVISLLWFFNFIQKAANKYFFFSLYNYQETLKDLSQRLNYLTNLDEVVGLVIDTVKQTMRLDKVGILLTEEKDKELHYSIAKVIGFNEKNGISLVQDNFLTKYLQEKQKPLVKEELSLLARDADEEEKRKGFLELESNMEKIEASLCLPLRAGKKVVGIVVLGEKISKDAYTKEDLELLDILSLQAGIAIDNARLYKKIEDLNQNLQQKVDEQTKEIRRALEVEKKAHQDLIKLDEAKTNFMLVTQHHLRTPLTVTAGLLDLLIGGTYGKIPKKILEVVIKANEAIKKEMEVINDLLNVSSFQFGKGSISPEPGVSIENILKEIVNSLKPMADDRKIYLKLESPKNIPDISADERQLKMALQNIIDNAIKYTKEGGVKVKLKIKNEKVKIMVEDTGIGLEEEDKKDLFKKAFQRSKEVWSANAIGKGIGLYLSAQIIKAHKGSISVESEGRGKGSSFNIELPISLE